MYSCPICNSQSKEFTDMKGCIESHRYEKPKSNLSVLQMAVNKFGYSAQILKSIEELAELTIELSRWNGGDKRSSKEKILEEIADVKIMSDQLVLIFSDDEEMKEIIDKKVKKLFDSYLS